MKGNSNKPNNFSTKQDINGIGENFQSNTNYGELLDNFVALKQEVLHLFSSMKEDDNNSNATNSTSKNPIIVIIKYNEKNHSFFIIIIFKRKMIMKTTIKIKK